MLRFLPLLACAAIGVSVPAGDGSSWVGGPTFAGERIAADLPPAERLWNIGSRVDGLGMCVTTSVEMAARFAGLNEFEGFRDWCAREPGGAYPEKLADQVTRYCKAKGIPEPRFLQYEGPDPGPVCDMVSRTGRIAGIAYGQDPRYAGLGNREGTIAHMVCMVHCGTHGVVLDNNPLGIARADDRQYVWMPRAELLRRMQVVPNRRNQPVPNPAWLFAWLAPPAPPAPWTS